MAVGAKFGVGRPQEGRWLGLASVARERASEQATEAARLRGTAGAAPHLEQRDYLLKLAEVYERRSKEA